MPYKDPQKKKEYDKRYREENREKMRIIRMKSYYKHRKKEIDRQIKYAKNNPEVAMKCRLNYETRHKERIKAGILIKRAKKHDIPFDDSNKLEEWLKNQDKICHYCGVSEADAVEANFNRRVDSCLQIDRIEPDNGYVIGNVALACQVCNYVKGNWFSEETMKDIGAKYVRKLYKNKSYLKHL